VSERGTHGRQSSTPDMKPVSSSLPPKSSMKRSETEMHIGATPAVQREEREKKKKKKEREREGERERERGRSEERANKRERER